MSMGPDELVRMGYVASRHYRDGRTRIEIADEMGLSRFKVARILEKAVELGIVRVEIVTSDVIDLELSVGLQTRFGLKRALAVVTPSEAPEVIQEFLGKVAAQLLTEIVVEGDLLGFTAGRTLNATASYLTSLAYSDLVALGGVAGPVKEHGVEVIRRVGRIAGGETWPIFAPLIVQDPVTATALRNDPLISEAFSRFDRVTKGVVAIGSWSPPDSQLYDTAKDFGIADDLLAKGVVAELCATLLDRDGNIVSAVDDRAMSITAEQLRNVPEVIMVGGGPRKTLAVRSAIKSGLIDSVVTDARLAQRLLASED
ncbi:sugar-binding transcriptional regulator [Lysinibacter cavernae]|uniref:DNA-binding transcriptional regulator LsrR (DeoR family) n=1 Tax=Lysinibacter cavernae TaxID=1640652 RepID=A0A7X5R1S4_9MICO|nr:sugar-binding domain-containing protein [Lysinibacter cavernae]NIH53937.1 DNA-binding transcriptional regulator LsrR (DeoR family) [Lysinibacter cavernae]